MKGWLRFLTGNQENSTESSVDPTVLPESLIELADFLDSQRGDFPPAEAVALKLGNLLIKEFGGRWREHPFLDQAVESPRNIPGLWLAPLAIVEKKWELSEAFSLSEFIRALPRRLEAEEKLPFEPGRSLDSLKDWFEVSMNRGMGEKALVSNLVEEFRAQWMRKFKSPLPLSLQGVRQVDSFLRTNYLVWRLSAESLVGAGFFIGEVGRNLFGGTWAMDNSNPLDKIALRHPELDFYPVGRIFKMMVNRPEKEPLDEYLRLIPSARKALRDAQGTEP